MDKAEESYAWIWYADGHDRCHTHPFTDSMKATLRPLSNCCRWCTTNYGRLAAARMAQEKPGQTLQATALVHEAYVRLVDIEVGQHWDSRGHFFAAAAEAMRRILVERARRKKRLKRGGGRVRARPAGTRLAGSTRSADEVLAVDEAMERLSREDLLAASMLKLKYYGGLSVDEAAAVPWRGPCNRLSPLDLRTRRGSRRISRSTNPKKTGPTCETRGK